MVSTWRPGTFMLSSVPYAANTGTCGQHRHVEISQVRSRPVGIRDGLGDGRLRGARASSPRRGRCRGARSSRCATTRSPDRHGQGSMPTGTRVRTCSSTYALPRQDHRRPDLQWERLGEAKRDRATIAMSTDEMPEAYRARVATRRPRRPSARTNTRANRSHHATQWTGRGPDRPGRSRSSRVRPDVISSGCGRTNPTRPFRCSRESAGPDHPTAFRR